MTATMRATRRHELPFLCGGFFMPAGSRMLFLGAPMIVMFVLCVDVAPAFAGAPKDWSTVPGREVVLFQPGQRSWEWALSQGEHAGANKFREGKNCRVCHDGGQKEMGQKLVAGSVFPATRPGHLSVIVKAAHDKENIYFYFAWPGEAFSRNKKTDAGIAARVTLILDDGAVKEAARAGCWGSCHDDALGMVSAPPGKEITKYLLASRSGVTRRGGGENYRAPTDLAELLGHGRFLEYWQAQIGPEAVVRAVDGYILERRHENQMPLARAEAGYQDGSQVVVLARKLRAGSAVHKDIIPEKIYSVGFAIHDDFTNHRFHYVSFEYSLRLNAGPADFIVVGE